MPSPFPGMDPYIEGAAVWPDFHNNLATEIQAQLNRLIQPRYYAALTPFVSYELLGIGQPRRRLPDVGIIEAQPGWRESAAAPMIAEPPVESQVLVETPVRLYRVQVFLTESQELVTAIEILSPANKRRTSEGRDEYFHKRREILASAAHLLEIDLLRGGERPPLERPVPVAPYYVVLSRAERRPTVAVWPIQLEDRLPILPVPLVQPDPDVPLDLGVALASIYERGAYALRLDYSQSPPPPPLSDADTAWVDKLLSGYKTA